MFNSVINSIKYQTERLKETYLTAGNSSHNNGSSFNNAVPRGDSNSNSYVSKVTNNSEGGENDHSRFKTVRESLSFSRLKENVVQTSSLIKQTISGNILPKETSQNHIINGNSRTRTGGRNSSSSNSNANNQIGSKMTELKSIPSSNRVGDGNSSKVRSSNSTGRSALNKCDTRRKMKARGLRLTSNQVMGYSTTSTLINDSVPSFPNYTNGGNDVGRELIIREELARDLPPASSSSSEFSEEDEEEASVGDKFTRAVTGIGYRASKRRSDREEIRRRLALESDEMNDQQKPRKNLHSRLQSSMNLQICFMNETASDSESPNSDTEIKGQQPQPASLPCVKAQTFDSEGAGLPSSEDFFARQGRLQAEARQALAQAKEMARLQMTQERDKRSQSPITVMVRNSLEKVGVGLPPDRRRVSRQLLTEMNVAQLQVIVNDLHSHIEKLNETLVSMLLERDDLHMEQDSMLVDIEDLTRYLAAKYNSPHQSLPLISASQSLLGKK